jgi:hypothetical protein
LPLTEKLKKENAVLRTQRWGMKVKLNCSTTEDNNTDTNIDNKQSENQTNMNNADDIDSLMPEVQTEDMGSTEENNNMVLLSPLTIPSMTTTNVLQFVFFS